MVQLSHSYMTTGKTISLTRWTFVGKVMSLLLNMLSRFVITFLPRMHYFMANRWGINGNSERLLFGALESLQMVTAVMEFKDVCSLDEKL